MRIFCGLFLFVADCVLRSRQCGALVCDSCSSHRVVIATMGMKPRRVCDRCNSKAPAPEAVSSAPPLFEMHTAADDRPAPPPTGSAYEQPPAAFVPFVPPATGHSASMPTLTGYETVPQQSGYGAPQSGYGAATAPPQPGYGVPQPGYGAPQAGYGSSAAPPQAGYGK